MNKKILGSIATIGVVVGLVAGGTWAYFTGTAESEDNVLGAGTVELEAGQSGTAYWTVDNIKPGDAINGSVRIENTGTVPIAMISGNVEVVSDVTPNWSASGGFADVIQITRIEDSIGEEGNDVYKFETWFGDTEEPLTLAEFAEGYSCDHHSERCQANWHWGMMEEWGDMEVVSLAPGQAMRLWLDMEFMTTGEPMNEYQEADLEFKLDFMGLQVGAPMPDSSDTTSPAYW